MNRRTFAKIFSAVIATFGTSKNAAAHVAAPVAISDVWLGYGPIIADRLVPGMRLETKTLNGRVCAFAGDRFLGFLPNTLSTPERKVFLESAVFADDGRLKINVKAVF